MIFKLEYASKGFWYDDESVYLRHASILKQNSKIIWNAEKCTLIFEKNILQNIMIKITSVKQFQ